MIPHELKGLKRWICWKFIEKKGEKIKVPINPLTGGNAQSNNPNTWTNYYTACEKAYLYNGLGFMLGDGVVGVDLDKCFINSVMSNDAQDIIKTLNSYTEYSYSGQGIHIICKGTLPEGRRRKGNVEMYSEGRYFIMTGNTLDDGHAEIEERTKELKEIHSKYLKEDKAHTKTNNVVVNYDIDVVKKASAAKNGRLFDALYSGNYQVYYKTQSEADISLCNILAFWTGKDASKMDSIFRQSGLYRDKWDEKRGNSTYGEKTIQDAISNCQEIYNPHFKTQNTIYNYGAKNYKDYFDDVENPPKWLFQTYGDLWNAQRVIDLYGDDIRYNPSKGWLLWNGNRWVDDDIGAIRIIAIDTLESLSDNISKIGQLIGFDSDRFKAFCDWVRKCKNTGRIDNMLKEIRYWRGVPIRQNELDKDNYLLCCNNGTVDLNTRELLSSRKEDYITKMCNVEYDKKADCPTFKKFLNRIFDNNKNTIRFVQKALGYTISGSNKEQCLFICHGTGCNGKSTLINIISELMGDFSKGTNFDTFSIRNDSNTNDIARLVGSRMVTAMEIGEGKRINEALIKQLTGGDTFAARFLHKEYFDFIPTFKVWMATNHLPEVKDGDDGTWRRFKTIPFEIRIPDEEKDLDLYEKLRLEMPGILNWILEGFTMWKNEGLGTVDAVEQANNSYRKKMDSTNAFLSDLTKYSRGKKVKKTVMYEAYVYWCRVNDEEILTSVMFTKKMREKGAKESRDMYCSYWKNIELKEDKHQQMEL